MTNDFDVYTFLPKASDKVLHKLEHIHGVRCIATLTGAYEAFAVATLESFDRLEGFLDRVRRLGDPVTAVGLKYSPQRIVWSPRPPILSFIQLNVDPKLVHAAFDKTLELANDNLQHLGTTLVAGNFDLLIEVGGESFDLVRDSLLDVNQGLSKIDGLQSSVTSFGFIRYYRRPHYPDDQSAGGSGDGS
ncbi:MAG TPA: hypothetical protein VGH10_03200 [Actinomycetota bacterium]|jgi:hypothetical protein